MLVWVILRSTGARTANPEQSVPAPQRWVSHLLSENKTKRICEIGVLKIFTVIILYKVFVIMSTEALNNNIT